MYGLTRPQPGYGWYRYYDDAVLADRDGRVLDYRRGIDWDARDNGRYVRDDRAYDRYRSEADLPPPPPPPPPPVARRDDGVGGAVIGGVVGGVAGNVVAGRGNRLGGTVLGAGVGALAGTAIDRAEDRRAPPPPPLRRCRDRPDSPGTARTIRCRATTCRWRRTTDIMASPAMANRHRALCSGRCASRCSRSGRVRAVAMSSGMSAHRRSRAAIPRRPPPKGRVAMSPMAIITRRAR
ncbi:glycine zipper 2TM domain-containing protein [Sphingomonas hankookensis]|uniref:glycine zipper 2TM domain-containing protein n=1 Tax=Sphingomonas hankookensis TaxID=563996 RepID=UPI003F78E4F0